MEIKINGAKETARTIAELKTRASKNVALALGISAQRVADTAKMNVMNGHSRTGELAGSISWRRVGKATVAVFANAGHASYHEFGTGQRGKATHTPPPKTTIAFSDDWIGRPAFPYLHPALKQNEKRIRQEIDEALERSI